MPLVAFYTCFVVIVVYSNCVRAKKTIDRSLIPDLRHAAAKPFPSSMSC